jgi:hypothetical protein
VVYHGVHAVCQCTDSDRFTIDVHTYTYTHMFGSKKYEQTVP